MKKLILLLSLVTLLSCSSSDDNSISNSNSNSKFHPPAWIQGTWGINNSAVYKFTSDDFIMITSNVEISQKGSIAQVIQTGNTASVIEDITNSSYNFTMKMLNTDVVYKFSKIDATHIRWDNYPYSALSEMILTKQ